jgi:hypothetical protein
MSASFQTVMSVANTVAMASLAFSIYRNGLSGIYPAFFRYVLISALTSIALLAVPTRSTTYGGMYIAAEIAVMVLAAAVVMELYRSVLSGHQAIYSFVRKSVLVLLGVAATMAVLTIAVDAQVLPEKSWILHRFFTFERIVEFAILVLLLVLVAMALWFPLNLRRNIVIYIGGFVVHFFARIFGLLMANLLSLHYLAMISNVLMIVSLGCTMVWLYGLRRSGEDSKVITGHRWNPAAMQELTEQLAAINASVGKLGRS